MQRMEGVEGELPWGSFSNQALQTSEDDFAEEEEQDDKTVLQVLLRPPHFSPALKMDFPELCRKFSAVAWCAKSNLICCAVETCSRDQGSTQEPVFWIPMHLVDPERPTEHSIFNVPADSPGDFIQHLEWSPNSCTRALLVVNAGGRASIWSQVNEGGPNVAHTCNGWNCEYEWRQEQSISTKWLESPPLYRWTPSSTAAKGSLEEKYLPHQARASARWPNFLCVCSVFWAGTVQLHWKQWPASFTKWFATKKGVLGAGASGVFTGDAIISDCGSLLVAAAPVGNPSTVVVWEVTPWDLNTSGNSQQVSAKIGMSSIQSPLLTTSPSWPGFSPLAAYLFTWQEQSAPNTLVEKEECPGPLLHCSVVSNFSAYVSPDAAATTSWGSGVTSVAFDPSRGGSALVTTVVEGYYISPGDPDAGPALTGWRILRWECGSKPVNIHPLLENTSGPPPTMTTWTSVAKQNITRGRFSTNSRFQQKQSDHERPVNPRSVARVVFAAHGGELAVALFSGEVHVFSGPAMTPVDLFHVKVNPHLPTPAFSPTSCCLASVWHDKVSGGCTLRIAQMSPVSSSGPSFLERHLADRFWWSLVSEVDWWDVIATTQAATEDGLVTVAKVMSALDTDFHALYPQQRHHYGPALDRIKCRVLEGVEAADVRVLVLDMQGRLMLDILGCGIEAALMNPSTLIAEPWQASSETLTGLGDSMAVDPALVQTIQAYVDGVLDLASHFLTRLRRYASFCRTLTAHAASGTSSATTASRSAITPSATPTSAAAASQGGLPAGTVSSGGTPQVQAGVQAWVQGAIAKINSSSTNMDSPASALASATVTGPTANLPLSVSTATFPGTPAVRLISDCHFLHRLCQLLLFCLIFRKRQFPRHIQILAGRSTGTADGTSKLGVIKEEPLMGQRTFGTALVKVEEGGQSVIRTASTVSKGADDNANLRAQRVGSGNCGQGYSSDEVKYLFLVLVDLCKRTAPLPHPLPKSQLQSPNTPLRLHFIDGQFTVAPEVVEASLGPHMQNLPRPRGADAAGLLMRELELHPPAEDWNRRMLTGGPLSSFSESKYEEAENLDPSPIELWPRKRRRVEHDAAFGLRTAVGLGSFTTLLGSRRDVITSQWKPPSHGVWHKCLRCGRQTSALGVPSKSPIETAPPSQLVKEVWFGRWAHGCPMCGGRWSRIV